MTAAQFELPPQHRKLSAALVPRHLLPVGLGQPGAVVFQYAAIQVLEALPDLIVGSAIKGAQLVSFSQSPFPNALKPSMVIGVT